VAPLEPWEKVLVDGEAFLATDHGELTCIECHSGTNVADKDQAHAGMIASPSEQPDIYCAECHEEDICRIPECIAQYAGRLLDDDQRPQWEMCPKITLHLDTMFNNHCATCHTSCGECHVSQPKNVGGGLFTGHVFEKTPPMTRSCTACHGSRVGNEFLGKNEGFPGDVHFREARMNCVKCHEGAELHGMTDATAGAEHRLRR
jgi:hypothetical protein